MYIFVNMKANDTRPKRLIKVDLDGDIKLIKDHLVEEGKKSNIQKAVDEAVSYFVKTKIKAND